MNRNRHHTIQSWFAGVALLLASSGLSNASTIAYLKILDENGQHLKGGTEDINYRDWIRLDSFGQSQRLVDGGGGGGSTVEIDCFTFLKQVDRSSPLLQRAMFQGDVLESLELRTVERQFNVPDYEPLIVEFGNVSVCGIQTAAFPFKGATAATEQVTVKFKTISWVYRTGASAATQTSYVYDLLYGTNDETRDDDGDGINNKDDPDDDNDGISDEDEIKMKSNPLTDDSANDDDGDGMSALQEYLAGTQADDPNSRFGIYRVTLDLSSREPLTSVDFPTIGGRHYKVFASGSAANRSWVEVDAFTTADDEAPQIATIDLGAVGNPQNMNFRVEVSLPTE